MKSLSFLSLTTAASVTGRGGAAAENSVVDWILSENRNPDCSIAAGIRSTTPQETKVFLSFFCTPWNTSTLASHADLPPVTVYLLTLLPWSCSRCRRWSASATTPPSSPSMAAPSSLPLRRPLPFTGHPSCRPTSWTTSPAWLEMDYASPLPMPSIAGHVLALHLWVRPELMCRRITCDII